MLIKQRRFLKFRPPSTIRGFLGLVCQNTVTGYTSYPELIQIGYSNSEDGESVNHGFILIYATKVGSLPGSNLDQHCLVFSACERGSGCY